MAFEFKRLADVEALSEVPENATVLAEVDGSIKRVPGNGLGGSGNGIVLVMDPPPATDATDAGPMALGSTDPDPYTFTANMDFADAMAAFRAHEITSVAVYGLASVKGMNTLASAAGDYYRMDIAAMADITGLADIDCLVVTTLISQMELYWTASGISTKAPIDK